MHNMKTAKKLTAGVVVGEGIHSVDDPRFLEAYNARRAEATRKQAEKDARRKETKQKKVEGVRKLREKYGHERTNLFAGWKFDELGTYLQYKKQFKTDKGMPKKEAERRARCMEWMNRASPTSSPCASDDEGGGEGGTADEGGDAPPLYDAAAGLLEMRAGDDAGCSDFAREVVEA